MELRVRRFSLAVGLAAVFAGGLLVLGGFLIVHHTGLFSRNAHAATPATQDVQPGVSAAVYRAAVQRACDRRRLAVSALAHRLHRHPEAIGPTMRRLLR